MSKILDLCATLPVEHVEPGAVLLEEGVRSGKLLVLREGKIEVLRGDTQVSVIDEAGSVFGEMSVLLDVPHTASVRTVSASAVHVIKDAESFLKQDPEVGFHVARMLAVRLNSATSYLVDVKQQYASHGDHLNLVGDVLDTLLHSPNLDFKSDLEQKPDSRL